MGSVCSLFYFFVLFFGGSTSSLMLIGWRAANDHVLYSWAKYSWADDMVASGKERNVASDVCFACLTWLYGLFVRRLISLTNAFAGCGRPTLNFIERFWLGLVSQQRSHSVHFVSVGPTAVAAYVQIMPTGCEKSGVKFQIISLVASRTCELDRDSQSYLLFLHWLRHVKMRLASL